MPGQNVTLNFDQGTTAHLILKDSAGVVTTDLGTYSIAWSVDAPATVAIHDVLDVNGKPLSVQVQAATPAVDGVGIVTVTLTSSDPATHPAITNSFSVTIANVPPPPPGPVSSVDFTIDAPGPRLF